MVRIYEIYYQLSIWCTYFIYPYHVPEIKFSFFFCRFSSVWLFCFCLIEALIVAFRFRSRLRLSSFIIIIIMAAIFVYKYTNILFLKKYSISHQTDTRPLFSWGLLGNSPNSGKFESNKIYLSQCI